MMEMELTLTPMADPNGTAEGNSLMTLDILFDSRQDARMKKVFLQLR